MVVNKRLRSGFWQEFILWVGPIIFLCDLVLLGPLGFLPTIHGRYLLFVIAAVCLLLIWMLKGFMVPTKVLGLYGWLFIFLLWNAIWATVVPIANDINLVDSYNDANAFLFLILVSLFTGASRMELCYFRFVQQLVLLLSACLALGQMAIWLAANLNVVDTGTIWYFTNKVFHSNSVYIGPMPDGFFRVFWISSIWFIPALFWSRLIRSRILRFVMYSVLTTSIIISYSRGLWIAVLVGFFVSYVALGPRGFGKRLFYGVAVVSVVLVILVGVDSQLDLTGRASATFSRADPSISIRLEQAELLLEGWAERPVTGWGYGAPHPQGYVRSETEKYSYEIVPLAMLMKLGVLGLFGFIVFFAGVGFTALRHIPNAREDAAAFLGALTALMVFSSTNPLLINFVGMGVLSALLIQWCYLVNGALDSPPHRFGLRGSV